MEVIGFIGTTIIVAAYAPQIYHLVNHRECACGVSISSWLLWLTAGVLLLIYAISRQDSIFTIVQVINIAAVAATVILVKIRQR